MDVNKIINKRIKKLYKNDKALFSRTIDVPYKNLASKIKTIDNKIKFVDHFLSYLNLKIKIVKIRKPKG